MNVDVSGFPCAPQDARIEWATKHGRKQSQDVDPHGEGAWRNSGLLPWRRINTDPLDQGAGCVTGLGAYAQPVLDPLGIETQLLALIFEERVEPPEFFDDAAIARGAFVHCIESVEGTVPASHAFES
jgi:hypothetical protein